MNTLNFVGIPAQMFPDQEIVVFEGRRSTYDQLWGSIRRLGQSLRRLGVRRGDRVAVLQTNSDDYVAAYFASAAIGAVFVPLNYRAKRPELDYMVVTAELKVLMVGDRYVSAVQQLRSHWDSVDTYIALESQQADMVHLDDIVAVGEGEFEETAIEEEDTTLLMYTSGTTSRPKGVMLTYNDFTAYVCGNVEIADGSPRGVGLLSVPLYHIAGVANVMTSLFSGRKLVILRQFDPVTWLETVGREQVTHAFVVPTMMKQLIDHPDFGRYDLSSLEHISYGGATMPFPVIRRAVEMFPRTVGFVNAFGQTETTSTLTILGPDDHRLDGTAEEVQRNLKRLTSIGRPLPDVQVKVVDERRGELPSGEIGELWVRTSRTMKGYAGAGGKVDSPEHDGWLPTHDMAWIDDDGYLFLAGRKDDMIIRGGENISPAEVEAVLYSCAEIEEAAVIGVPDVEWGQRVVAVVVPRSDAALTADDVGEFCRQRLASFKKPEVIYFTDALPKNPLGKILRKDLRTRFAS